MFITSSFENETFSVIQSENKIVVDSNGKKLTLRIRIPEYVDDFTVSLGGNKTEYSVEKGYAVIERVWDGESVLSLSYNMNIRRIYANPKVSENIGKVAVSYGPYIMCAEGIDNGGNVDIEISEKPCFIKSAEFICGKASDGSDFCLIPYYKWCNRAKCNDDAKMSVWLRQENMKNSEILAEEIGGKLYNEYK